MNKSSLVKHSTHFYFSLILFFEIKINFLETYYLYIFHIFYNKFVCFVIGKNYFFLLCFCFKNLDLLDWQTTQFDFSLSTLFVIFTFCGLKLCIKSLHPKQYVVLSSFLVFIGLILIVCFSFFVIWQYFFEQFILSTLILLSGLIFQLKF